MFPSEDLDLALTAALAGADIGLAYFNRAGSLAQDQKDDGSLVTEAEVAVETEVRRVLQDARLGLFSANQSLHHQAISKLT